MLTTLAAIVCLGFQGQQAQPNAGSQLVSKMLSYYSDAKSLTGTISYSATDGAGQVAASTLVQYERPSKLYIRQTKGGQTPQQWVISSDGKYFSYEPPANLSNPLTGTLPRLVEPVMQVVPNEYDGDKPKTAPYDFRQIYAVGAPSLMDRSFPLDVAIGRHDDLKHDILMLMTVKLTGKDTVNGVEGNVVGGSWRPYGDAYIADPDFPPGRYDMVITDEGKLLRYRLQQFLGDKTNAKTLLETWIVDLNINAKPDPALFTLVK